MERPNTYTSIQYVFLSVLIPFFSYFVFALKNTVFLFGMNPVVWLRNQMREVVNIRRELGVRLCFFFLLKRKKLFLAYYYFTDYLYNILFVDYMRPFFYTAWKRNTRPRAAYDLPKHWWM